MATDQSTANLQHVPTPRVVTVLNHLRIILQLLDMAVLKLKYTGVFCSRKSCFVLDSGGSYRLLEKSTITK